MKQIRLLVLLTTSLLCLHAFPASLSFHERYAERVEKLDARKTVLADAGEAAAKRIYENPGARIRLPYRECEGFREELIGRAGGLTYIDCKKGTARDVVLFAVRDWERQAFRVPALLEAYRAEGTLVILFASKAGMPADVKPDFLIDNGAPDGSAAHGAVNMLVNSTLSWMWCCEYAAAFTRAYQVFPAITKSIGAPDAWAYNVANSQPDEGPRYFRCEQRIEREDLATAYLNRVRKLLSDVREVPYQRELDRAAGLIADRLEKGGRVGMAGLGHLILEETKHDLVSPMLGFRAVSMLPDSFARCLAPGDLLVWITYAGMDSLWDDYGKAIHDAQLDVISSYAQPYFVDPPDGHLAHIPAPWTCPDAEVAIPVQPYCMAPISAINRVLVARTLDEAVAAELARRKASVEPCPLADPEIFYDTKCRREPASMVAGMPSPDDRWGLLSSNGTVRIPPIYESRLYWRNRFGILAKKDGKYGFIDPGTGATNVPFAFDEIRWFRGDAPAMVRDGAKWGIYDFAEKRWVTDPVYDSSAIIGEGPLPLVPRDGHLVSLDEQNREREGISFRRARYTWFHRCYFFEKDGLWGMADPEGKTTLPPSYDNLVSLSKELLGFEKDGRYGLLKPSGDIVRPAVYDMVERITRDTAVVVSNHLFGLLDSTDGTVLVPPVFLDRITAGPNGLFLGRKEKGIGLYTRTGEEVLPPIYREIRQLEGDLCLVREKVSCRLLSLTNGPLPFKEGYDAIETGPGGSFLVQDKGAFGIREADGTFRIPLSYDYLAPGPRGEGHIGRREGKWYVIDSKGKATLFPIDCDYLASFCPSRSYRANQSAANRAAYRVAKDGRWGLADREGHLILPLEYSYIYPVRHRDFAYLAKGGAWRIDVGAYPFHCGAKWGVVDKDGEILISPEYDAITSYGDDWQFAVQPRKAFPVP